MKKNYFLSLVTTAFLMLCLFKAKAQVPASFTALPDSVNVMPISFITDTMAIHPTTGDTLIITDWEWNFGNGTWDSIQNPTHTYTSYGTKWVALTVGAIPINGNLINYTFMDLDTFLYDANGWARQSGYCGAYFSSAQSQLDSLKYYFTNSSYANSTNLWDFGDGDTSSLKNPSHTYAQAGAYQVCLTAIDTNACTMMYCDSIMAGASPTNWNCSAFFWPIDIPGTSSMYLLDISYGSNLSYSWDFGDGATSNQSNPTHTYTQTGTYYICLSITSTDSLQNIICSDVYCSSVLVDSSLLRSAGFTIEVVRETDLLTNTKELMSDNYSLYPNPMNDQLYIELNANSERTVLELLDFSGKLIMKRKMNKGKNIINVQKMPSGMYILNIRSADGYINHKILKN